MATHDDWLLSNVFEPIAAAHSKLVGMGCFALGNVFMTLALVCLSKSAYIWWGTKPENFNEWSFLAPLFFTTALIVNVWVYVVRVERFEYHHGYPHPLYFRQDNILYWHRFFLFTSLCTFLLLFLFGHHDSHTKWWEVSLLPWLIGVYFFSCTRLPPKREEEFRTV